MGNNRMAYDLYKFLQKDVTVEKLQESTDKAFSKVDEKHIGFKRLEREVAAGAEKEGKSSEEAEKEGAAVAAKVGREKYGKAKFQKMAAAGKKAHEGILVKNPSVIDNPEEQIQTLAEDKDKEKPLVEPVAENPDIKTADAGITEDPEKGKFQKDMEKRTPDVSKLTQNKDGKDPDASQKETPKVKEEKKITPKITGVEEEKTPNPGPDGSAVKETTSPLSAEVKPEKVPTLDNPELSKEKKPLEVTGLSPEKTPNAQEGILVPNPSVIDDPEKQIQTLAEERVLTTVSDENVANDLKSKYPGSRVVNDMDSTGKKQFIVMVKEAVYQAIMTGKPIVEEVSVAVTTDDKTVDVTATPQGTTVTTSDTNATQLAASPVETQPAVPELAPETEVPVEEPVEEDDLLVAEKLYVAELLKGKTSLTEKEKAFITAVEAIKLSEAKKIKVAEKMKALKDKKVKK